MPELAVTQRKAAAAQRKAAAKQRQSTASPPREQAATRKPSGLRKPATVRERRRREEALRRHREDARAAGMAPAGEVAYRRAQLQLGARLTGRLAATHDIEEMTQLVVDELH